MTIEQALAAKLTAVLAGLVGGRLYPDALPETKGPLKPSAVYQRAGDDDSVSLDGVRSPVRRDVYSVELWSARRSDGWAFREAMKAAFSGANCAGRWGGDAGVFVTGAVAKDASADTAPPLDGGDNPDRAERLTLAINYRTDW